jgi:hypothetical protein
MDEADVDYTRLLATRERAKRAIRATECRLRCLPRPRKHADLQDGWIPPGAIREARQPELLRHLLDSPRPDAPTKHRRAPRQGRSAPPMLPSVGRNQWQAGWLG